MFDRFDPRPIAPSDTPDQTEEMLPPGIEEATTAAADDDECAEPSDDSVATTLPVPAGEAFETFCDLESTPRWVSVVQSVKLLARDASGRPTRAAFIARLEGASIGYTLSYSYDEARRRIAFTTAEGSTTAVSGHAEFMPLGDRACLVQYRLSLQLPAEALPEWEDPFFSGHAASVVMNDFRDYILRLRQH
jgi:uncharacterized membrane protein